MIMIAQEVKNRGVSASESVPVDSTYDLGIDRPARRLWPVGAPHSSVVHQPSHLQQPEGGDSATATKYEISDAVERCAWRRVCGLSPSVRLPILTHMKRRLQCTSEVGDGTSDIAPALHRVNGSSSLYSFELWPDGTAA